eukprot:556913-Prorocentrum_minimum.AAC.1
MCNRGYKRCYDESTVHTVLCTKSFLDVARPPSRDPPPGDRLPGGPEIWPGVGARPGNVKETKSWTEPQPEFPDSGI